jgi:hypothetical protein
MAGAGLPSFIERSLEDMKEITDLYNDIDRRKKHKDSE